MTCILLFTCNFASWLLDSLHLPRYGFESKKRYTPNLLFICLEGSFESFFAEEVQWIAWDGGLDYDFYRWSVVSFIVKKLAVNLFMVKQCIYLVMQMNFMWIYLHFWWINLQIFLYFQTFCCPTHRLNYKRKSKFIWNDLKCQKDKTQFEGKRYKSLTISNNFLYL